MSDFLKEGSLLKRLKVLEHLDQPRVTHQRLAESAGVSTAMVNNYLSDLLNEGYVDRHGTSGRNVWYELTERGRAYRNRLLIDYNAELIRLHREAIERVSSRIRSLFGEKRTVIVVCPAGDTTEVVLNALVDFPTVAVRAVLDDSKDKQRSGCLHHNVQPFGVLREIDCDGVLISTVAFRCEVEQRVTQNIGAGQKIWHLF